MFIVGVRRSRGSGGGSPQEKAGRFGGRHAPQYSHDQKNIKIDQNRKSNIVNISIYKWDAFFWVPGSKAPDPPEGFRHKKRFFDCSRCGFHIWLPPRLITRVQRPVLIVFAPFWELLGTSKTCDSVQYILRKLRLQDCSIPRHLSVVSLKRFGASGRLLGELVASLLGGVWSV